MDDVTHAWIVPAHQVTLGWSGEFFDEDASDARWVLMFDEIRRTERADVLPRGVPHFASKDEALAARRKLDG